MLISNPENPFSPDPRPKFRSAPKKAEIKLKRFYISPYIYFVLLVLP